MIADGHPKPSITSLFEYRIHTSEAGTGLRLQLTLMALLSVC